MKEPVKNSAFLAVRLRPLPITLLTFLGKLPQYVSIHSPTEVVLILSFLPKFSFVYTPFQSVSLLFSQQ